MAGRAGIKITKIAKKTTETIKHPVLMKLYIPAGKAAAAPPLGPQLGQRSIQIAAFCKEFNDKTAHVKPGTPLPTRVKVHPDRSFDLTIHHPPVTYFLKMAAGCKKGSMTGKETAGKVSLKHIYEIAKIKSEDPTFDCVTLENVCKSVMSVAHTCGIEVVKELNAEEYGQFLEERKIIIQQQQDELEELRQAKMLRL